MKTALLSYCLTVCIAVVMALCVAAALSPVATKLLGTVALVFAQLG